MAVKLLGQVLQESVSKMDSGEHLSIWQHDWKTEIFPRLMWPIRALCSRYWWSYCVAWTAKTSSRLTNDKLHFTILVFLDASPGKHCRFLRAGCLWGSLMFWMASAGQSPTGMQFGRKLPGLIFQCCALCSPLNLGSESRKQNTSQTESQDTTLPLFTLCLWSATRNWKPAGKKGCSFCFPSNASSSFYFRWQQMSYSSRPSL